jgi:hypothetical protein
MNIEAVANVKKERNLNFYQTPRFYIPEDSASLVIAMRTPPQDNPFDSVSKQDCKERLYGFFLSIPRSKVGLGKVRAVQLF